MAFPCGGKGVCKKCVICFEDGAPQATKREKEILSEAEIAKGIRLACSCEITKDCRIVLPNREEDMITAAAQAAAIPERMSVAKEAAGFGIACDIGTTTIAVELVELSTGRVINTVSGVNHQRSLGADVMSRITYANESEKNAKQLQVMIRQDMEELLQRLISSSHIVKENIRKMVIACNVTMVHLLMGYSTKQLGEAPFIPETLSEINTCIEGIPTVIMPGMQAFVGGDITAGVYALDMDKSSDTTLLADLGTNGEMVLCTPQGVYASSVAAGPAFEGGKISCGMPSVPGAIRSVMILGRLVRCNVIGNIKALGMCGTGILEGVCELLRTGMIDESGTLVPEYRKSGYPFTEDVFLTQDDIRQVQLAKASICAGIECMLQEANITEVDRVYLAGGFGFSLDVSKAVRIGVFPKKMKDRTIAAGNTALLGAEKYLLHPEDQKRIQKIAADVRVLSLADSKEFHESYICNMNF